MATVFSDVTRQIYTGSLSSASLSTGIYTPFLCVLCTILEKLIKVLGKHLPGQADIPSVFQPLCIKVAAACTGNVTALRL